MSTLHSSVAYSGDAKKTPGTITFYNSTKYGVDVVDQMARKYSVKAGSRRWPLQVWYNVLDLAGINSWVLYRQVTGKKISRRNFILQLATERSRPYTEQRAVASLQPYGEPADDEKSGMRRQCRLERLCKGNKTADICFKCQRPVCGKCSADSHKVKRVTCIDCKV
jgi:hypothetical protein